ncbi:hypothetical protein PRIPAC_90347 [Pristionchus pacificus]|uniref:TIL domain-containing protein n=1 Tax=Pristionchus pacificus TaxID=54126 RepID=A0A2A6CZ62_PRIPA|nr:hypothetical protein PRIPAC_90347 [Pristionchus pacificus]|eukprot:PDM83347.1 hypothetical protein PRIPAC_34979 [Pristionchus pacificus]
MSTFLCRMKLILSLLAVISLSSLSFTDAKRRLRSRLTAPIRDESSPALCLHTEYHVRCGPERHCERSCDNLFSPPRCFEHDPTHPKCYFPRCLCKPGFVRDKRGKCIKPKRCRVSFEEQFLRYDPDGLNFKSTAQKYRMRHVRHGDEQKKREDDGYFW